MSKKSKKFEITSKTVQDLKRQLEEQLPGKRVYLLMKQPGKDLYEWSNKELYEGKGDKEFYSSKAEFKQIKGISEKRDIILIIRVASEDDGYGQQKNQPTNIH